MLFNILISEKVNTINNIKIFLFFFIFVLTFFLWHIIISIVVKISQFNLCRCGGTGRRTGLKILRLNKPCRFDSGHLHQEYRLEIKFLTCIFLCYLSKFPYFTMVRKWNLYHIKLMNVLNIYIIKYQWNYSLISSIKIN